MSDCSLRSRGSRFEAAAFLSHSLTKCVSARSFVQDSGARSWALCFDCSLRSLRCSLGCRRLRRRWRNGRALFRHLLLQIGGANIENPLVVVARRGKYASAPSIDIARSAR